MKRLALASRTVRSGPSARAAELAGELQAIAESIPAVIAALRAIAGAPRSPAPAATAPLYVPDHLRRLVVDAGTLEPAPADRYVWWETGDPAPGEGPSVPWWPAPAPYALDLGVPLHECSPGMTDWRAPTLLSYATTMAALDAARSNYAAAAGALAAAGRPRSTREKIAGQAARYRAWHQQFAVIADDVAAAWAAAIHARRQALTALLDQEGLTPTMPTLTTTPAAIATVAEQIRERITQGQGGRLTISDNEVAFGWSAGLPPTLISYVASAPATTRHIDVLRATDSGDPTVPVPEGGTKPDAVDFTNDDLDLAKYAGIATLTSEAANWVANVEQAVAGVMIARLLRGVEADLITAMTTDAGLTATGTDLVAAVLDGIAKVAGAGGVAGVLALSAADWVKLMSQPGTAGGYVNLSNPEAGPAPTWMGLNTVICPTLATGSAFVADPRSVVVLEAVGAPLFIVDLTSKLRTNHIQIAAETWAAGYVANPGGVCSVTVTAAP